MIKRSPHVIKIATASGLSESLVKHRSRPMGKFLRGVIAEEDAVPGMVWVTQIIAASKPEGVAT